jgi:hypothetical protein
MPEEVLEAYRNWKNATASHEASALELLVAATMKHGVEITSLITADDVRAAVLMGTGDGMQALAVSTAYGLYKLRRPTGDAAVKEATEWIRARIQSDHLRREQFILIIDELVDRAALARG